MAGSGPLEPHVDAFQRLFLEAVSTRPPPDAGFAAERAVLARLLPVTAPMAEAPPPRALPAGDHLDRAIAQGRAGGEGGLIEAVAGLAPALHWTYGYPDHPRFAGLADRIAFCEVVGLRAFRRSEQVRLGLTLMAPGTIYPAHAHPAVETYLVISGTALWQAGQGAAALRPPGAIVWHPGEVSHVMTTLSEPLLAVWSWTGDILTGPRYLG
ncbi:transcriptional regulator [Allostella vacuolata]|nr:transcriptional regulator [Stella vacuolata]